MTTAAHPKSTAQGTAQHPTEQGHRASTAHTAQTLIRGTEHATAPTEPTRAPRSISLVRRDAALLGAVGQPKNRLTTHTQPTDRHTRTKGKTNMAAYTIKRRPTRRELIDADDDSPRPTDHIEAALSHLDQGDLASTVWRLRRIPRQDYLAQALIETLIVTLESEIAHRRGEPMADTEPWGCFGRAL